MDIEDLLKLTVEKGASDLHLSTNDSPILRINGDLQRMDMPAIQNEELIDMLESLMYDAQKKEFRDNLEVDYSYKLPNVSRFRINAYRQQRGVAGAFRAIPFELPTFDTLELPEIFKDFCSFPNGLILITGPTGCGKSTTLAAMINYLNNGGNRKKHILTIEDPVEYVFKSNNCLIHQREANRDTLSFSNALRSALREDPDVIMVGEMRDLETIRLAITAAETGHLVFATMHTSSAAKTIDRIIDAFPTGEKDFIRAAIAESLRVVITQTLIKQPDGGQRAAEEIMICTSAIRNLIREHKVSQIYSAIQTGRGYGMRTLEQHIDELVAQNLVIRPKRFRYE